MTENQPDPQAGIKEVNRLQEAIEATYDGTLPPEEAGTFVNIIGRTVAEEAFGICDYPSYCKFYGDNPSFCDRSCDESVWDQV